MTATDPGREVTLVAGDATYTLYAGNRALRMIERETGKSLLALFSDEGLADLGIGTVTTVVWGLIQRHHPELTVEDVDDVIDAAGYDAVTEAMSRAMDAAMPAAASNGAGSTSGKALARNGTGTRSSPAR